MSISGECYSGEAVQRSWDECSGGEQAVCVQQWVRGRVEESQAAAGSHPEEHVSHAVWKRLVAT